MSKEFNITGVCVPERHYMADTSDKIKQIKNMVEAGRYFTINRPRQYGKTTTLYLLKRTLSELYLVIDVSFAGIGDDLFSSEHNFCRQILSVFARCCDQSNRDVKKLLLQSADRVNNFIELSEALTQIVQQSEQKIVLLIDEVDKSSNNRVFMQFLDMLRTKYLAAATNSDATFHSIILAGVHDIKNLKLAMRDENDARFNSPWNIADKFTIDMALSEPEIASMLQAYADERQVNMDIPLVAKTIFDFTSGYPYLVSDICKTIADTPAPDFTVNGIYTAVKQILQERNTLFDDLIKNLANNEGIRSTAHDLLVLGNIIPFSPYKHETGVMYGIFKNDNGRLAVHNHIFQELIYRYLCEEKTIEDMTQPLFSLGTAAFTNADGLNMELVLAKFQDFMYAEYRNETEKFFEAYGRLVFLAYLRPIINGKGFSFVEPQTRENKRMDIVVVYGAHKYIIELKVWRGPRYESDGLEQLADYMQIQNAAEGYLLVFASSKEKTTPVWKIVDGARIYEVVV